MKAVLLLHGFITDKNDFEPLFEPLKRLYDCVDAITLPGHGEEADYTNFTVDATFDAVLEEFDFLNQTYDTIDVIGFSMGGALATWLSGQRKFNKLVLLSPANRFLHPGMIMNSMTYYVKYLSSKNRLSKDDEKYKKLEKKMTNVHINSRRSMDMALKQLLPNYNIHTVYTFSQIINKCNKGLKKIPNPTLILWGKLDQLVPQSSIEQDFKLCTNENKKIVIFEDYSHLMLHSVNTDKLVSEIIHFLK